MKKRLLFLLLLLLLGGAGALALLGWMAVRQITPERLVREIEADRNCRAEVQSCRLSLWCSPARLEIGGVTLVPRDAFADRGVPLAQRPPIELHATYLKIHQGVVEVDLLDLLLRRRLTVRELVARAVDMKCDLLPGGDNTLKELFARPREVSDDPGLPLVAAPAAVAVGAAKVLSESAEEAVEPDDQPEPPQARTRFNARQFALPSTIQRVALENSRLRFRNRKTRGVIELAECTASLTDIAIDPQDLARSNRATFQLDTRLYVDARVKKSREMFRHADLGIRVSSRITPFTPAGELNPDMLIEARLLAGSMLQDLPVFEKIEKAVAKAARAGLVLPDLSTRAELLANADFHLSLHDNRTVLTRRSVLPFTDYSLALAPGSFLDAGEATHQLEGRLTFSPSASSQALAGADQFLGRLGESLASQLRSLLVDPLVEDGLIQVSFTSSGELSDPEVKIQNPITDLADQLKSAGDSLLEGVEKALRREGAAEQ